MFRRLAGQAPRTLCAPSLASCSPAASQPALPTSRQYSHPPTPPLPPLLPPHIYDHTCIRTRTHPHPHPPRVYRPSKKARKRLEAWKADEPMRKKHAEFAQMATKWVTIREFATTAECIEVRGAVSGGLLGHMCAAHRRSMGASPRRSMAAASDGCGLVVPRTMRAWRGHSHGSPAPARCVMCARTVVRRRPPTVRVQTPVPSAPRPRDHADPLHPNNCLQALREAGRTIWVTDLSQQAECLTLDPTFGNVPYSAQCKTEERPPLIAARWRTAPHLPS